MVKTDIKFLKYQIEMISKSLNLPMITWEKRSGIYGKYRHKLSLIENYCPSNFYMKSTYMTLSEFCNYVEGINEGIAMTKAYYGIDNYNLHVPNFITEYWKSTGKPNDQKTIMTESLENLKFACNDCKRTWESGQVGSRDNHIYCPDCGGMSFQVGL